VNETVPVSTHWPDALGEPESNQGLHSASEVRTQGGGSRRNVGRKERQASVYAGAALMGLGLFGPRRARALSLLSGAALLYRGMTGHCHLYDALNIDSTLHDAPGVPPRHGFKHEQSITIQAPAAELYRRWRTLSELSQIMRHLERVTVIDDRLSEWVACGPLGARLKWRAEIFQDRENELIAWRSVPGGDVDTAGSIHFQRLGDRSTELQLSLKYSPPGGKLTSALASFFGQGAEDRIDEDLRRFKCTIEANHSSGKSDAAPTHVHRPKA